VKKKIRQKNEGERKGKKKVSFAATEGKGKKREGQVPLFFFFWLGTVKETGKKTKGKGVGYAYLPKGGREKGGKGRKWMQHHL